MKRINRAEFLLPLYKPTIFVEAIDVERLVKIFTFHFLIEMQVIPSLNFSILCHTRHSRCLVPFTEIQDLTVDKASRGKDQTKR